MQDAWRDRTTWEALGFTDPAAIEEGLRRNDLEALAAVAEGRWTSPLAETLTVPTLVYKGGLEAYYADHLALYERSGAVLHEVPGADHFGTFANAELVVKFVEPFLADIATSDQWTTSDTRADG